MLNGYFIQPIKKMSSEWTKAIPSTVQGGQSRESLVKEYMALAMNFTQG